MARTVPLGLYGRITLDTEKGLDAYAWPGGYPIVYYCQDGATLCADCATKWEKENSDTRYGDNIIGADALEGSAVDHGIVTCEECNKEIVGLDEGELWCPYCGNVYEGSDSPSTCPQCGETHNEKQ